MSEIVETLKWGVEHGAAGVLAVFCGVQSMVIHKLWKERNELHEKHTGYVSEIQEARISDMTAMIEKADNLHERAFKTASDLEKAVEFINRRGR